MKIKSKIKPHFKSVEHLLAQKCARDIGTEFSQNIINNLEKLILLYNKKTVFDKWCMIRTLIQNDVSEVPWDVLIERSKHLTRASCGVEELILRYGETVGRKLATKRHAAVARNKESYTKNHTESEWNDLCERKTSNLGEAGYIEKYGEVVGKTKWNEYLRKWNVGIQKRKLSGKWKNGLTLVEMQNKHGIKDGYARWKNRIDRRVHTLSMDGFIGRFGEEIGRDEYYKHITKMTSNCRRIGGYSKISQTLFNAVYKNLNDTLKSLCKYAILNGEEVFYVTENSEMKLILVDFKCGNAIIEFDGDYWHSFPETIRRDKLKQTILESRGYKLIRVTETDFHANEQQVIDNCVKFINDNYKQIIS